MPSRRFMTDKVTVWTAVEGSGSPFDPNPDGIWHRDVYPCTYAAGGETQTDQNGAEFKPRSTFYVAVEIARGVRVALGDVEEVEPPATAETVRKVDTWTPLRGQARDWVLFTG